MTGHSHRSTIKNGHKPFKSKHASKGVLKNKYKGKVEKESNSQKQKKGTSKLERKNISKQLRENKILQTAENRKMFEGNNGVEKIVTVIPLNEDITAEEIVNKLIDAAALPGQDVSMIQGPSVTLVKIPKFKSNLKFIIPDLNDFISILDAAKVADYVVFGLSSTSEVDPEYGEQIIRALELQGIGHVIGVIPNLSCVHSKQKFQNDVKQSLSSYFKHFFPTEEKVYNLENASDSLVVIRSLCQRFPKSITWRDSRGWLVADKVSWEVIDSTNPHEGCLKVEGIIRGVGFNVNKLVHIPGQGDFQIERIEKILKQDIEVLNPDENQEILNDLAPQEIDMEEEEEEEEEEDWENEKNHNIDAVKYDYNYLPEEYESRRKLKLKDGTSEYQARWYLEDDLDENEIESEDEIIEDEENDNEMNISEVNEENESYKELFNYSQNEKFIELSPEVEEEQLKLYRERENEDHEFPDEIELNPLESGKERLKRYRGLKNLHNTIWDCDEYDPKAPSEWKRLLRISNFKATKNKILKQGIIQAQVTAGNKVNIYIKAPEYILTKLPNASTSPFIIYGLLEHEQKLGVINFSISSWQEYEKPIPSKDTIIVQYGPRRQIIQPIFSSASNTPNNVHKYERFLHKGTISIATTIAPVMFTNAPALFFKQTSKFPKKVEFIGNGSFLNVEHQRILAKRVILTGHPVKIHKNVITVRYMFFNPNDIQYYKAIPLFTKSGRSGFIKESLGTHGYFKANFDGKISSQDVVAMSLYKRVWPKNSIQWTR